MNTVETIMSPILTLIAPGANDNYCGNFNQRLEKNVNKICDNITKLKIKDVKFLIVDWGSPDGDRLSDVLKIDHPEYVEFIHIPQSITNQIAKFSAVHTWNVGARKADSEYIMLLEGDTYIPFDSFKRLKEIIDSKKVQCAWGSRYQIPYDVHSNCESFIELDEKINEWHPNNHIYTQNEIGWTYRNGWIQNKINLSNFGGGATSLLVTKNIYESCRGVYERLIGWGWSDIELHRRISQRYKFDEDLEDLGVIQFTQESTSQGFGGNIHGIAPNLCSPTFAANDENWGLGNYDLKKYKKND